MARSIVNQIDPYFSSVPAILWHESHEIIMLVTTSWDLRDEGEEYFHLQMKELECRKMKWVT